jgi:O-antigen/teichoic acid export membrane protein
VGKSQIKSGVILSYLIIFVNTLGGLLLTPFLLRKLGQSNYGLYTLIASFSSYMMLMDFGTTTTTVRYIAKYRAENKQTEVENFIGSILSFYMLVGLSIIFIGSILFANLGTIFYSSIAQNQLYEAKLMFAFVIVNSALVMLMHALPAIIRAYEKFTFSKSIELIRVVLRVVLIYIFVSAGHSALAIVIIDTIVNLLLAIFRLIYINKVLSIKLSFRKLERSFIMEIGQFSFYVFIASIVNQVNVRADQIILGIVSSTDEIAICGVSMKLNQYYHQMASAISGVFFPKITKMVTLEKPMKEIEEFVIRIGKLQGKLLIMIIVGFIVAGKQFISIWAGSGYESVYYIVLILMISNLASYTQGSLLLLTQAMNKHKKRNIIYFIVTIFNIIITIPLAKYYGAIGAVTGTGISMFIGFYIIMQIYYHKETGINMFRFIFETLIKPLPSASVALLLALGVSLVFDTNIYTMLLQIITIVLIYIIMISLTDLTEYEKNTIKKISGYIIKGRH